MFCDFRPTPADHRCAGRQIVRRSFRAPVLAAALLALAFAGSAAAQTSGTGAIGGTVTDPARAVVPGAEVIVTSETTGDTRTVTTAGDGTWVVQALLPGSYAVVVSKPGFQVVTSSGVRVNVTERATLDVQLPIGQTSEKVTVEGRAALVQIESSALGRVAEERVVRSLPLVTRNYTQILGLSPGVVTGVNNASELGRGSSGSAGGALGAKSVNGARQYDNNFEMNGVPVNDLFAGGARFSGADISGGVPVPNPDTLEQFKVQTGQYDASFGRNAGANVNIVTKSGSNTVQGTAFEFFRDDALNANDFFNKIAGRPKPALRQNQFGVTGGGPVVRDKVLFFGSYQGTHQTNGAASPCSARVSSPALTDDRSAAALGRLFAGKTGALGGVAILPDGSNINPIALRLLQMKLANGQYLFPTPQVVDPGLPFALQGFSVFSEPCTFDENQFMANEDILHSTNSTFTGRLFVANSTQENTIPAGNVAYARKPVDNQYVNLSTAHRYIMGAHVVNEARFGFNDTSVGLGLVTPFKWSDLGVPAPSQSDDLPNISITGSFNVAGSTGQVVHQRAWTVADSLTWVRGSHLVRVGFGTTHTLVNPKDYRQTAAVTFQSFPDFLLGLPGGPAGNGTPASNVLSSSNQTVLFERQFRQTSTAVYANDDYKISSRLTLNLGVRYERIGHVTDQLGRLSNFDLSRANPNAPAAGTLEGFVVANDYAGGTVPASVVKLDNPFAIAGQGQNTLAPRAGFAWQVLPQSSRLVVRGGWGVYHTQPPALSFFFTGLTQPWSSNQSNSGTLMPSISLQQPFVSLPTPASLPAFRPYSPTTLLTGNTYVAPSYRPANTQQYSVNTQAEIVRDLMLEVGYVGASGRHLIRGRQVNQASLASTSNPIRGITTNTVANVSQRVSILGIAATGLTQIESEGESQYNALQVSLAKRPSHGLQFLVAYTLSRSEDTDAANVVAASEGGGNIGNQLDPDARWGRSSLDRTHRLVVSYSYDLPFFTNGTGVARAVLGGWSLAGVTTIQSGTALTITATNSNSVYGITNDRAQMADGCDVSQVVTSGAVKGKLNNYFNRACFAAFRIIGADNRATDFGSSGVGIADGPGQRNFDLVIAKRIPLGAGRRALEFRTELFNVFNTPQFANPVTNYSAANFGQITALAVNPRVIQFGLKVNF